MSKNSPAKYYQKKEKKKKQRKTLNKEAHEMYQDLSEEERNKKHEYGCKQYRNLPVNETEANWVEDKYYKAGLEKLRARKCAHEN